MTNLIQTTIAQGRRRLQLKLDKNYDEVLDAVFKPTLTLKVAKQLGLKSGEYISINTKIPKNLSPYKHSP